MSLRHDDRFATRGGRTGRFLDDVILDNLGAVYPDVTILERNLVSGQPNDAFDVRLVIVGRIEHHDVAALDSTEWRDRVLIELDERQPINQRRKIVGFVGVAIDEQHLSVIEIRIHAVAVDLEIEDELANAEEDDQRENHRFDGLAQRT